MLFRGIKCPLALAGWAADVPANFRPPIVRKVSSKLELSAIDVRRLGTE